MASVAGPEALEGLSDAAMAGWVAIAPGNGHGIGLTTGQTEAQRLSSPLLHPRVLEYRRSTMQQAADRLGTSRLDDGEPTGNLFPNFSFVGARGLIRVWHPRGPGQMEAWSWTIVDKAAPPDVKDIMRLASIRTFSPSGILEQDDGENWSYCAGTGGHVINGHRLNYQMGLGNGHEDERWPGRVGPGLSEQNQRSFYRFWADCMSAETSADMPIANREPIAPEGTSR